MEVSFDDVDSCFGHIRCFTKQSNAVEYFAQPNRFEIHDLRSPRKGASGGGHFHLGHGADVTKCLSDDEIRSQKLGRAPNAKRLRSTRLIRKVRP